MDLIRRLARPYMRLMTLVLIVAAVAASGAGLLLAQEGSRELVTGTPVNDSLDSETFAQTYWFEGSAGQAVTLFASTADEGLDLAMLLTDADGNLLVQDADVETAGAAAIANFTLSAAGRYYVTVLRLTGADGDAAGDFTLTFVLADGADAAADAGSDTATTPVAGPTLVTLTAGIQVALTWDSTADLDLEVRDPFGNSVYWDNPTAENGIFDQNVNANCVVTTADSPTELITWIPGASPTGSYEIIVYYTQGCDDNAPANLTLNTTVDGTALEPVTGTLLPGQEFLSSFVVTTSGQAAGGASGVNPGELLSNAADFLTGQLPISSDSSVVGRVDSDTVFQSYSFSGSTGDIVTVRMDATGGNLDPKLFLLDPNGNVVGSNDDALNANTTNAEIGNQTLVSDGLYTIVATRYGLQVGGTEGSFNLTLSGAEFDVPPALANLNLPAGSIEVSLLWNTSADLQLLVREPSGTAIYDDRPRGDSGGTLAENGNVNCTDTTTSPVSYVYWPPELRPAGTYEVEVWYQSQCNDTSPVTFTLTVRVDGQVILSVTEQPIQNQVYLTNFTLGLDGSSSAGAGGFISDSSVLDIGSALSSAIPVSYGDTVAGTINQATKFQLYTFEGEAGDIVRIGMDTTAGTLDTQLFLLQPDGSQLAANDDAVVNETTNSLIDNFALPADGEYIIVATHYGLLYGGTSGTYNLSVVQLN
jgi:hypothetical protein